MRKLEVKWSVKREGNGNFSEKKNKLNRKETKKLQRIREKKAEWPMRREQMRKVRKEQD